MGSTGKETGNKNFIGKMPANASMIAIGTGSFGGGRTNGGTATGSTPPAATTKLNAAPIARNPVTPQT